jgi:hypothetical protein
MQHNMHHTYHIHVRDHGPDQALLVGYLHVSHCLQSIWQGAGTTQQQSVILMCLPFHCCPCSDLRGAGTDAAVWIELVGELDGKPTQVGPTAGQFQKLQLLRCVTQAVCIL